MTKTNLGLIGDRIKDAFARGDSETVVAAASDAVYEIERLEPALQAISKYAVDAAADTRAEEETPWVAGFDLSRGRLELNARSTTQIALASQLDGSILGDVCSITKPKDIEQFVRRERAADPDETFIVSRGKESEEWEVVM